MSYIGNQITAVPFQIDLLSGNASQTTFGPLVRAPTVASIAVFISGVYKTPGIDYTVNSDYITFTTAPASGTNNIVIHHIGNGFMATQVPGDGTVSGNKLQDNVIRANNIVAGQVLSNALASNVAITDLSANNTFAVPIFASNAARDIAITSPRDGLVALITTGSQFQGYVGSGWIVLNN